MRVHRPCGGVLGLTPARDTPPRRGARPAHPVTAPSLPQRSRRHHTHTIGAAVGVAGVGDDDERGRGAAAVVVDAVGQGEQGAGSGVDCVHAELDLERV
jgi:hypothetical protein